MKITKFIVVFALLLLVLSGCSLFKSKSSSGELGGSGSLSDQDLNAQQEQRFGDASIPMAEGENIFRDIHFDFDSSVISDSARQNIEYNLQILESNSDILVQLEGHCDERGTAEYNLALGARRAEAVKDVLLSYGISASRLRTISYGEEVPLDPENNETAWRKNRRAHFSAFRNMPK